LGTPDGQYSPADPTFYLHHTFVDKVHSDWQNNGGGSSFGGYHRNKEVSKLDIMSPGTWKRTVDQIFNELTPCVTYVEPSRRTGSMASAVRTSIEASIRLGTAASAADGENAIQFTSLADKKVVEAKSISLKILDPATYKQRVFDAAVEDVSLMKAAKMFSGFSDAEVQEFGEARKVITAKAQSLLPKDIRDPEKIVTQSSRNLISEAVIELNALQVGNRIPGDVASDVQRN
jgi:NOL1/NOP2/fmu family ribosome biogenesis protein